MTTESSHIPYSETELHKQARARTYRGAALRTLGFPLGGMGTGGCRLDGGGGLAGWRLSADSAVEDTLRVDFEIALKRGGGAASWKGAVGDSVVAFTAAFPLASLIVQAQDVEGRLEAYSPFIPQDAAATAMPAIVMCLTLRNTSKQPVTLTWRVRVSRPSTALAEPLPGVSVSAGDAVLQLLAPATAKAKASTPRGRLAISAKLAAGEEISLPLWLCWGADAAAVATTVATLTEDAERLDATTREFAKCLHGSTIPDIVRDAVAAQLADLQSVGTEQLAESSALPYFFSALSRTLHDRGPTGGAVDRQLADVLRLYGNWLLCGDDEWLRARWPDVRSTLEGLARQWDPGHHGVIDGEPPADCAGDEESAHTVVNGLYLAALRASEEMASQLDDMAAAERYRQAFEQGRSWMEAVMFGGEFFRVDAASAEQQTAGPCVADQLLGQAWAGQWKLGHLMEREMIVETLESIFTYNWQGRDPKGGPGGLCLCTWPHGGTPPGVACRAEAWPGAEYALAGLMIQQHLVDEGLSLVKTTRDRCDGEHGNPWPTAEPRDCQAVRPLAAYGVMLALMDFFYSAPARTIHFAPKLFTDDFACVFAVDGAWGMLRQRHDGQAPIVHVDVIGGALRLDALSLGLPAGGAAMELGPIPVDDSEDNGEQILRGHGQSIGAGVIIRFEETACVAAGQRMTARLLPPIADDDAFFDDAGDE